jgi:hypothetical protein
MKEKFLLHSKQQFTKIKIYNFMKADIFTTLLKTHLLK